LTPGSTSYPMWKDLPVPITLRVYLFNITNAEEVAKKGAKPILNQVGPYVFEEYHHKYDEIWNNDNGTVTYKQMNKWIPVSENLDELVTIVNLPLATMASQIEPLSSAAKGAMDAGLELFLGKEKLFVTKTAREILFDGYRDPLIDAADFLEKMGIKMPGLMSKFGFYFGKNNTWYSNGIVNVHTGVQGIGYLGRIAAFNYSTHSSFYPGKCGQYFGSPDLSPPYLQETKKQYIFNPDLGRTLELTLANKNTKIRGTTGYEYKMDSLFFANSTLNEENWCFEHGSPMPSGVFNASACRFGAPVYMSQPHFYQADPYYLDFVSEGSQEPNQSLHETSMVFEPVSGVAMRVTARFQVNVKLDKIPELTKFKHLPKLTYLPTIWFEEHLELPQKLTTMMWFLGNLTLIFIIMGALLIAIGVTLSVYGLFEKRACKYQKEQQYQTFSQEEGSPTNSPTNSNVETETLTEQTSLAKNESVETHENEEE